VLGRPQNIAPGSAGGQGNAPHAPLGTHRPNVRSECEWAGERSADPDSGSAAVRLDGQVELQPLGAKLIFRNTNTMAGPQSTIVEGAVYLTLLPIAQTYPFPQQEFVGGSSAPRFSGRPVSTTRRAPHETAF
jgi:hypothetical protein